MNLKTQYIEKLRTRLNALNTEISRLETAYDHVPPHLKVVLEEHMAPLHGKREEARARLADIVGAPGGLTEELKQNAEALWALMHDAMERTRRSYKQQKRQSKPRLVGETHQHVYEPHLHTYAYRRRPWSRDAA